MRTARLLSLAVFAIASVGGCDSGATNPVEVEHPATSPLTVAPSQVTLQGGNAIQLTATLTLPNGSRTRPEGIRWSSADTRIVQVDQAGIVQALQAGRTQIIAEWQDSRGSSLIVVPEQVRKKGGCLVKLEGNTEADLPRPCA